MEKLNSNKIIEKLKENRREFRSRGVKKLGLFGSYVKGKQTKGSDVDILVEFEDVTFDNYMDVLFLIEKLLKRKVDLIIEESLRPELNYVKREARYVRL